MPRALPPFPPSMPWDARELVRLTTPALEAKREREAAIRRAAREAIANEAQEAEAQEAQAQEAQAQDAEAQSAEAEDANAAAHPQDAAAAVAPHDLTGHNFTGADSAPAAIEIPPDPEPAMPHAQPAHPALIEAGATAAERTRARAALRRFGALLGLPHLCPHAACGRTRRCKGDPERCIPALTPKVPAPARAWVRTLLQAEENGVDPEDMTDQTAEWEAAHAAWLAGLTAKRQ